MRTAFFAFAISLFISSCIAQPSPGKSEDFLNKVVLSATPVKNQAMTGTCWSFSTTSLVESEAIRNTKQELDLSEMFTVRNIYIEKAKNYILRQGKAQFGEGGLGHDVIRAIGLYGAVPDEAYSGLKQGQKMHDHSKMVSQLQNYLDGLLKSRPLPDNWLDGYKKILDDNLGVAPANFNYKGKKYTPQSFAKEVLQFSADDYVSITSFSHHPYYKTFVLETPDNFADASFYNLPLNEMNELVKNAIKKGYTVMWDADVSNKGFLQDKGFALLLDEKQKYTSLDADTPELSWDAVKRQALYENLTTQDDHLMHITGIEKSKGGKTFFVVKNSWGKVGPYEGYINVSESYFAINTVSLVVPKAALSSELLVKLGIK